MKLKKWSYTKKYNIKAFFDFFPNSPVIFRQIKDYFFVYSVKWDMDDPVVTRAHLEEMERLLNTELGTYSFYQQRSTNS
ncbi:MULTISPECIES: hypothetical protein [unclassified Bacillus (in: firmicutes)]|uniref:hypothetical protein n=1 Tax=unclassified Bacillus (in: firmicutes) TaxID=185979 RepID=UPI0008F44666|nr:MULTISPECIES: hypothetical protein [unclassified Bacillus (in: firmicutes)]SFA91197.1 hypothetical protein SAMN02799634_102548 [Bacillus sp. UNCCL13]SFQ85533.1 hypothetical protein SAMN04488577_2668 [Bacillus sp. cl95]